MELTNYTKDGKCSKCGACCTNYLPMTKREIKRLSRWVKKHHYSADSLIDALDFTCPFLNKETLECSCYEIRPLVCQKFTCADVNQANNLKTHKTFEIHNLRAELFNQPAVDVREYFIIMQYLEQRNSMRQSSLAN